LTNNRSKSNGKQVNKENAEIDNSGLIKAIVLSIFDEKGPTPRVFWPNDLEEKSGLLIAMKTISLLMGDSTYQNGEGTAGVNYFGILPFPDLKLNGLTYFFLIPDIKLCIKRKSSSTGWPDTGDTDREIDDRSGPKSGRLFFDCILLFAGRFACGSPLAARRLL